MTQRKRIDVVVNPRAGAGRAARLVGALVRELSWRGWDVQVHRTERPGHGGVIVRMLIDRGANTIVVMGGDGSFHEGVQGLLDPSGNLDVRDTKLVFVPAGTGGDLRKTLGIPEDPAEVAQFIDEASPRKMDLGQIDYRSHEGRQARRLFVNIASFGVGGLVDKLVNEGPKWLGGKVTFFLGTLRASVAYKNVKVRVECDGELFYDGPMYAIAVANGRYFGGGMMIAPDADPFDGTFDVIALGDMSRVQSTLLATKIYKGLHLQEPLVSFRRAKVVRAFATGVEDCLLDVDGEAPGKLDATFTVLPSAVPVLVRT
jgi:YegS/Rv2252/BmrU family lipid kinase